MEGPANVVEGASGLLPGYLRATGRKMDDAAMKHDLRQFEGPLYIFPKFTSTSSSIGPFLDALGPVYRREKIRVADIERFDVVREWPQDGPFARKIMRFEPPRTIVGAQMNMNYSVSLFLHRGAASVYEFTETALHDKSVLEMAARTGYEQVAETAPFTIRVMMRDGRHIKATFRYSRGEKPEPETLEMRMAKFATLTRDRLTDSARRQVIEMVEGLDKVRDVAAWTAAIHKLLRPVKAARRR
ncbi:MAG: hypothetical protein ACKV2V_10465 [Blastocatellia bacterium]